MLLTISTTHGGPPIGFLLHKNPGRIQTFPLNFGDALVFYPEATEEKCTVALLLDIDPIGSSAAKGRTSGLWSSM
jgi:hypothetical protein